MLGMLWFIINIHLSDSSLMHNIDEFQIVLKLEIGEGVIAHAYSLCILCVIDPSKYSIAC